MSTESRCGLRINLFMVPLWLSLSIYFPRHIMLWIIKEQNKTLVEHEPHQQIL